MDRQKLEAELERLHRQSFAWALRCCFEDLDAAAEVLQNTYVKILEGKARFKGQSAFRTWLFSVIRFTAIDHVQRRKKSRWLPLDKNPRLMELPEPVTAGPETEYILPEQVFRKALSRLSPQQNSVLHLVFYQDCSIQEAADILQMQLGTARTHYQRGKQQLKKWLTNAGFTKDVF